MAHNRAEPAFEPQILSGWKAIANHLAKSVRTVQRYERDLGLPIHRPNGMIKGSVIATKIELDAWVAASPIRTASSVFRASSVPLAACRVETERGAVASTWV
jgi:hypothetical protein